MGGCGFMEIIKSEDFLTQIEDITPEQIVKLYKEEIQKMHTKVEVLNQQVLKYDSLYARRLETCIENTKTQINKILTDIQISGTQNDVLYGKVASGLYNILMELNSADQEQFEATLQKYLNTKEI